MAAPFIPAPPPTTPTTLNPMAAPFAPAAAQLPHASRPPALSASPRVPPPASAPSASPSPPPPSAAGLHQPFSPEEVLKASARTSGRKAVTNCLPPWLLKACPTLLAPLLAAEFNSWQRVGSLPTEEALSIITPILKAGGNPQDFGSYRGIAVGSLPAKLYASVLERRASDHTESNNSRATGQYGFRRERSTTQAAFVLRTLIEQHRAEGVPLWTCFVDFKQAYDTVPRDKLWTKLAAAGLGGWWLQAVQALYASVPMAVRTPAGVSALFQSMLGLKQGCPASCSLFGLFVDDLEDTIIAEHRRGGGGLALPTLNTASSVVPPLLFADDTLLLSTTAAGLQAQLDLLASYCRDNGLTVNAVKTKLMVCGYADAGAAGAAARRAAVRYGGELIDIVDEFKYLGIIIKSHGAFAAPAESARLQAARGSWFGLQARCKELGVVTPAVTLKLLVTMVESVLSHGAEIWAPELIAAATRPGLPNGGGSPSEKEYTQYIARLIGVPKTTTRAAVLAEAGRPPLWAAWLVRTARFWNRAITQPEDSVLMSALTANINLVDLYPSGTRGLARQPWAAQFAAAMRAVQMPLDLQCLTTIDIPGLMQACLSHHLSSVQGVASRAGATKTKYYLEQVWGGDLTTRTYARADYLSLRRGDQRRALAQLRTGSHWLAEETGRRHGQAREQRVCPHCAAQGQNVLEDPHHMVFSCPLYGDLRARHSELFQDGAGGGGLAAFLAQAAPAVASFVVECRRLREGLA